MLFCFVGCGSPGPGVPIRWPQEQTSSIKTPHGCEVEGGDKGSNGYLSVVAADQIPNGGLC